jgi:hypothetical protein
MNRPGSRRPARFRAAVLAGSALAVGLVPAAPASGQEATSAVVPIETDIVVSREPVTGLDDVVIELNLSGGSAPGGGPPTGGGGSPPEPTDPEDPPKVSSPFCLYVPPTGLSLTITSDNADENGGFFIVSEDGEYEIGYVVELASDQPGFPELEPFRSGIAQLIPQTAATSSTDCSGTDDNASLVVDFTQGTSFRTVLLNELQPGVTYVFRDVLVLNVSFYF